MKHLTYDRRWPLSLLMTLLCLLMPSVASANGAMSLALATFAWGPWFAYVVVTIVFEAAALNIWLHVPFARAFNCSLGANCLTALLGGLFSGLFCALLGFYGGRLNPNPFGQTLLLFTLFGSLSALVEAYFWRAAIDTPLRKEAVPGGSATLRSWQVTLGCLIVHLVGVPVGLAVLLIPSRPYPGLEGQVYATREYYLEQRDLKRALQDYISEHQALPPAHSYGELLQLLKPRLSHFANDPDLWAAAYVPDYHRFDTTERRRDPIEWNSRAAGYKLSDDYKPLWLIRSRYHGFCEGFVLSGWGVKRTMDPKELGYPE
ncbi:MAG: hypothetical protein JWL77_107 [Chthonomonadaceae bacterium]|nr:hypothetical protein [Chthonomonadaceae bacterium]